jgi:hypothetical protein
VASQRSIIAGSQAVYRRIRHSNICHFWQCKAEAGFLILHSADAGSRRTEEALMNYRSISVVLVSTFLLLAIGFAQNYQPGKIVSIAKHEAGTTPGHTDAPMKSDVHDYDVTISSGGTVYTALYHHPGDLEPAWSEGKEVQVYASGKTLKVKTTNGKSERLKIVSSKPMS